MQRHAVRQRNHTQVTTKLRHVQPMANTAILGLYLAPHRLLQGRRAPLQTNIRPLFQYVIPEALLIGV